MNEDLSRERQKFTLLRDELYDLIERHGLNHEKILQLSMELDVLILKMMDE